MTRLADDHDDVEQLRALVRRYEAEIAERDNTIERLREQLQLLVSQRFGASSEKVAEAQLGLFNEAEFLAEEQDAESAAESSTEVASYRRGTPKRKPLPADLPRIDIEHELPEDERLCPHHGVALERFDTVTSEQLDIVPAKVRVLRHLRGKYRCPCCEGHIRTAPMPAQPIPKSLASPGLLAYIATAKFVDAIPLYRQHAQLERIGFAVSRTTMASWMVRLGGLVQPLVNLLRDELLARPYLQMDETTVQVLREPGKAPESTSYPWAQFSPGAQPIVLFDYDPTRSGAVPMRLLEGFAGILHTDGYAGYDAVVAANDLERLYCWAHARRKFVEVIKSLGLNPNKLPAKPPPKARRAMKALGFIKTLYTIERRIRKRPPDERLRIRRAESLPVLEKLRAWLDETRPKLPPETALGKAMAYLDRHWPRLARAFEHGHTAIDTNAVENAIRPFCIGRKGWLFCGTVAGAKASANLYALVETAKANRLDPYRYLRHIFTELPKAESVDDFEVLLPTAITPERLLDIDA